MIGAQPNISGGLFMGPADCTDARCGGCGTSGQSSTDNNDQNQQASLLAPTSCSFGGGSLPVWSLGGLSGDGSGSRCGCN